MLYSALHYFTLRHPYLRFRTRLARHALLQLFASVKSSAEITLVVFAPMLLGLLALIALPGLYAATLPWPQACALVLGQSLLGVAPVWLLRKRLLPSDVLHWQLPLPVPAALELRANAAVASMLLGPIALAYAVSIGVWLYQWPAWLAPVAAAGIGASVLSLLLSWGGAVLVLRRRSQAALAVPTHAATGALPSAYLPSTYLPSTYLPSNYLPGTAPRLAGGRVLYLWRQLFWLPCWRTDNPVGWQQSLLFSAAATGMTLWLLRVPAAPAGLLAALTSTVMVLLTDRGDKAVREQIAVLRPVMATWPMSARPLLALACLFTLLPALLLLLAGATVLCLHASHYSHKVALIYLTVAIATQLAIAGLPRLSARGRVALVLVSSLILTAIGSELWN